MADGYLNFDTKVDSAGFNAGTKSITSSLGGLKSSLLKIGAAVGIAFGVSKLISFGKQAIETASDLQEVQNVVDTAFGSMSYKMEEFANTSIDKYGMSKLAAKQAGSSFMASASAMGVAQESASNMAISLTGLSGDLASFYNKDQDVAATALKSIFSGETETLKQFNIVMTDANLQNFALTQGITKKTSEMTQAEKVQLRYNYVMEQTKLAQGDFAKTQDSWANSTRRLSEKWTEFLGTIGTILIGVLAPAVKWLNSLLSGLITVANAAAKALSNVFGIDIGTTSSSTSAVADSTAEIADTSGDSAENYSDMADSAEDTANADEKQVVSFDKINKLGSSSSNSSSSSSNPNSIATATSVGTTPSTSNYSKYSNDVKSIFTGLKDWIDKNFALDFSQISDNFSSVAKSIKDIAIATFPGIKSIAGAALDALGIFFTGMSIVFVKQINTLSLGLRKFFDDNKEKIINGINVITGNLTNGLNSLKEFYNAIFGEMGASVDRMRETVSNAIANLLGGLTTLSLSIGKIVSDSYAVFTSNLAAWADENKAKIGYIFDSFQQLGVDLMNLFGDIFNDVGTSLSTWWDTQMAPVFDKICRVVFSLVDVVMSVWNGWIYPVLRKAIDFVHNMWDNHLKGVFNSLLSVIAKIGDCISTVWLNFAKPIVDWLVKTLKPIVMGVINTILGVIDTIVGVVSGVVSGLLKSLGGLIDFITGVFSGDWKKAWNGIKDFFKGIWVGIWSIIKGVINLIIDGLNALWNGLYSVLATIVNGVGGAIKSIGAVIGKDWGWKIPSEAPQIPKLATGTVVPANYGNFLATLGDNKREPEVVSPLSTMKQAFMEALQQSGGANNGNVVINASGDIGAIVDLLSFKIDKNKYLVGDTI